MRTPELSCDPLAAVADAEDRSEVEGRPAREELLHRHLTARLASLREELEALASPGPEPVGSVAHVGAAVVEAQRELVVARTDAERSAAIALRDAEDEAASIIESCEREAQVLRAVAVWLRQVPVGHEAGPPALVAVEPAARSAS